MSFIFSRRTLTSVTLAYLVGPVLLFVLGWCQWYLSFPITGLLIYTSYKEVQGVPQGERDSVFFDSRIAVLTTAVLMLWVFFSGIGGYWHQMGDFNHRNAIFQDLISYSWPVVYPDGRYFCYNFSYWLPAALFGKWCGRMAADFLLYSWTFLGVLLAQTHLSLSTNSPKRRDVALLILFSVVFWAGMDVIPEFAGKLFGFARKDLRYVSFTANLYLCLNRFSQPLLWAMLVFTKRVSRPMLVVLFACIVNQATLCSYAALILLSVAFLTPEPLETFRGYLKRVIRDAFSWHTFCAILIVLISYGFYLPIISRLEASGKTGFQIWFNLPHHYLLWLFLAGLPSLMGMLAGRKHPLYWACVFILFGSAFYQVSGTINDFQISSSLIAYTGLLYFYIQSYKMVSSSALRMCFYAYLCIIAIGPSFVILDNMFCGSLRRLPRPIHAMIRDDFLGSMYNLRFVSRYNGFAIETSEFPWYKHLFLQGNIDRVVFKDGDESFVREKEECPYYWDMSPYEFPSEWHYQGGASHGSRGAYQKDRR